MYIIYSGDTRGYTLGEPLPYKPSSVRSLSPVAAIVMRVLMHAVLLWTTCNKDDVCIYSFDYLTDNMCNLIRTSKTYEVPFTQVLVKILMCRHSSINIYKKILKHLEIFLLSMTMM